MENKLDEMSRVLEDLQEKQNQLDKKTKDAEEYRQLNNKLIHNMTIICISFAIIVIVMVVSHSLVLTNFMSKYIDANSVVTTTTTDLSTGSDSVLLNDINNSDISNISN